MSDKLNHQMVTFSISLPMYATTIMLQGPRRRKVG